MYEDAVEVWSRIQNCLREGSTAFQYDCWLKDLKLVDFEPDGVLKLEAPDERTRNWVDAYYQDALREAFKDEEIPVKEIVIRTFRPLPVEPIFGDAAAGAGGALLAADSPRKATNGFHSQPLPIEIKEPRTGATFVLNGSYTFDNFVCGPCNRLPHAAALAVAEAPGTRYNPFFIHGSVGLGKTHLLQAICARVLREEPQMSVLYLSCEEFVNQFIEAVERGELENFRHRYRYLDVLIIDDIHFLADKERTQEEFFHTFNTLYNAQKQIILSSDAPPVEIPTLEDRLVSRFKWGLVTKIESPAFETRTAILKKKARLQGIELPDNCLQFLAENLDSSIREIEGAITKVAGYARLVGRPISLALVKEALRDLLSVSQRMISIQDIINAVCAHYDVRLADLQSKVRKQSITFPRQICMYIARKLTKHSLEEIGGYFGGRDHTTVLHAIDKIRRLATEDLGFANTLDRLENELRR